MKRLFFVTGRPGIGKTSVLLRAVEELKAKEYKIGGMLSREARKKRVRVGFEITDYHTGRKGWLAHVNQPVGPKLGKYRVNLKDLDVIGAGSIRNAVENAQIILIDEIGPMELFSEKFKEAVRKALNSRKLVMAVVHWKANDLLISEAKNRQDAETTTVTIKNRDKLHKTLVEEASKNLKVE